MSDTLIGVIVGGCIVTGGNIAIQLLAHLLSTRKERQQQILKKELDRLFEVEELAGRVTEIVGSYRANQDITLPLEIDALLYQAGRFRRYPKLKQALRDLHNCAARLLSESQKQEDNRETRKEIEKKYDAFLKACDEVIGRR